MKQIIYDHHTKFYIDTKEIISVKVIEETYYSLTEIIFKNGQKTEIKYTGTKEEVEIIINKLLN